LAKEAARLLPQVQLLNGYASSEVGGAAVIWDVGDRKKDDAAGRPFPNTRIYVLDGQMQPAESGTAGEIYIGAPHLAQGYLGQPGLTAERLLPDPFGGKPGERMYRTGDLGSKTPDGRIAVLGRVDDQIKIRGFRVELGEIETVLREHPDVLDSAVIADATAPEDIRLTAYAVVRKETPSMARALRHFVADRLPEYMHPAAFVLLGGPLPRTPLGKLDREKLPEPLKAGSEDRVPPQTPIEIAIAEVWKELLGVDTVGVGDNFLERGGHSLLAAQAIARLRKLFGIPLSPRDFLDHPTIAEQAKEIESATAKRSAR
jgi:acyl-coenzyme A synthetase/AMP-(fatty) acid ligase/acyl carrier protein